MRVLVIFTGGTIGCSPPGQNAVLSPAHRGNTGDWKSYYLLTSYIDTHKQDDIEFDVIEPLNTLSENMTVPKWFTLAKALQKIDFSLYQGIIITHGTDTLAYTAAFLGILLSGVNLPVVLVSANKNLYDTATNGHQNFHAALDFIRVAKCTGVYAAYSYRTDETVIYLGTRMKQSDAFIDRYESTDGIDFGLVKNGSFIKTCSISPAPYKGISILGALKELKPLVMLIQPYVGLDYSLIRLDNSKVKAVLHTVYHSFTACVDGDDSSILDLGKRCAENDILLYTAPFSDAILKGGARYESTNAMLMPDGHINFLCGHSVECAYAKLLIAVNLFSDTARIKDFLSQTIFYENVQSIDS